MWKSDEQPSFTSRTFMSLVLQPIPLQKVCPGHRLDEIKIVTGAHEATVRGTSSPSPGAKR
jgi:hypothetical protein